MTLATITDNTSGTYTGVEDAGTAAGTAANTLSINQFGDEWAALRFSGLSNIPSNATITAVTVRLYLTEVGDIGSIIFARALDNWVEGTSLPSSFAAASATIARSSSINAYTDLSAAGLVTDVQNWVSGVNPNYGWRLDEATGGIYSQWRTSEGTDGQRPELVVTYSVPGGLTPPYTLTTVTG